MSDPFPTRREKDQFFFSPLTKMMLKTLSKRYKTVTGVFCPTLLDIPNILVFDFDERFSGQNYVLKDLSEENGSSFTGDLVIVDPPYTLVHNFDLTGWFSEIQKRKQHLLVSVGLCMQKKASEWNLQKQAVLPSYNGCCNLIYQHQKGVHIQAFWYANFNLLQALLESN